MSLLVPTVGEKEHLKVQMFGRSCLISSSTNASPSVITVPSGHGFKAGDKIIISNHLVNTAINGVQTIASVTSTTITTGANGNGVGGATGQINTYNIENLVLHLRNDAITPATSDVASTYTESTFTGYSAKTLTAAYDTSLGWNAPTGGNPSTITNQQQSWSATSVQNCNGYFMTGADTGLLRWSENFASTIGLTNPSTLQLTPQMQLT